MGPFWRPMYYYESIQQSIEQNFTLMFINKAKQI